MTNERTKNDTTAPRPRGSNQMTSPNGDTATNGTTRRQFVAQAGTAALAASFAQLFASSDAFASAVETAADASKPVAFTPDGLRAHAKNLATKPFALPKLELDPALEGLTYDKYRDIRFRKDRALWRGEESAFQVELFHAGFYFKTPVAIHIVENGMATPLKYTPELFDFGPLIEKKPAKDSNTGFAGFRIHHPVNKPDVWDEITVFQGASYLRGIGKDQIYGLSARGLAVDTGQPSGEEFPLFRSFWLERPKPGEKHITVHALLDSKSVTGAYSYRIEPGDTTVMDVTSTIFPRRKLEHVGIAPLTSMFWYGPHDRRPVDDFRPRVHDSEGLSVWNGMGEWIWRPLVNHKTLQFTALVDENPKGFGLMQRSRAFHQYEDLEARYEKRPSLWVEPTGDWGKGTVELLEIPTKEEIHDNIVAFWRPKTPLEPGKEYSHAYRLHWSKDTPINASVRRVEKVLVGEVPEINRKPGDPPRRRYIIDFASLQNAEAVTTHSSAEIKTSVSAGEIANPVLRPNPETGGWRLSLEFDPKGAASADLSAVLIKDGTQISEKWVYRWTA